MKDIIERKEYSGLSKKRIEKEFLVERRDLVTYDEMRGYIGKMIHGGSEKDPVTGMYLEPCSVGHSINLVRKGKIRPAMERMPRLGNLFLKEDAVRLGEELRKKNPDGRILSEGENINGLEKTTMFLMSLLVRKMLYERYGMKGPVTLRRKAGIENAISESAFTACFGFTTSLSCIKAMKIFRATGKTSGEYMDAYRKCLEIASGKTEWEEALKYIFTEEAARLAEKDKRRDVEDIMNYCERIARKAYRKKKKQ